MLRKPITPSAGVAIEDVKILSTQVFEDKRGYFFESYNQQVHHQALTLKPTMQFVQDNVSFSEQGVLRGLHYQYRYPQAKLLRVLQGEIWDVIVDLREFSLTFGRWMAYTLSAQSREQLYVPVGCAHGFITLTESALVMYKVSDYYRPDDEYCLRYDDSFVGIEWPEGFVSPRLSSKDAEGLNWAQVPKFSSLQA